MGKVLQPIAVLAVLAVTALNAAHLVPLQLLADLNALDLDAYNAVGAECDVGDPENNLGIYLPHPTNCSRFLKCDNGEFIESSCSGDLLWNVEVEACDFAWNVTCTHDSGDGWAGDDYADSVQVGPDGPGIPDNTGNPVDPDNAVDADNPVNSDNSGNHDNLCNPSNPCGPDESDDSQNPPGSGYSNCPAIDPLEYTVILPHPDCGLHYMCVHGRAFERPCPTGLHWNALIHTCDWPAAAQCVDGAAPNQPNAVRL